MLRGDGAVSMKSFSRFSKGAKGRVRFQRDRLDEPFN